MAGRLRARGDDVVALVRETSDAGYLSRLGCRLFTGDALDPPERTAGGMAGCDAVVHAAARVFQKASRDAYVRSNVAGTERVLSAASLECPRVVHLSSVAVYAGLTMDRPQTEDRWTMADPAEQGSYAASKHLSEQAAWRLHDAGDIRLTTVRPSVVYGERDRSATPVLVRWIHLPVVPLPGGGRTTLPLVYAGNVAAGAVAALDRAVAIGRAYNLAMDRPITAAQLAQRMAEGLGLRPRTLRIPAGATRALAAALRTAAPLLPHGRVTDLIRGARSLSQDNPYPADRARAELDWTALVPHEEGIRRTMVWWRSKERQ